MFNREPKQSILERLPPLQAGVIYIALGVLILMYVSYQLAIGQVYTKSGVISLSMGWPMLAIEVVGSVVGIVRGINKLAP